MLTCVGLPEEQLRLSRREDELRKAHTVFQSTFDKEKRREAERKAELERQRRVEVLAPAPH